MKKTFLIAGLAALTFFGCKRGDDNVVTPIQDFETGKSKVLNDFVDVVAIPQYNDLAAKAANLNNTIIALNATANQQNLDAAQKAWKDMRLVWEQCEGFLFGPVDYDGYDPKMDTWPTDYTQMDSLMASSVTFNATTIEDVNYTLRGFHPIEYILFGDQTHGARVPGSITTRQKEYMVSLGADLKKNCDALAASWQPSGDNYGNLVKTAGQSGNHTYAKRSDIFLALVDGLAEICGEVGDGKMKDPFGTSPADVAPQTVESPYSGNSVSDFKNNIIGLQNVYLCKYGNGTGISFSNLVAVKNQALDNKLRAQITTAINSFDNITMPYEKAIISQRTQIQQTMTALNTLAETIDVDLRKFVVDYIKD